MNDKEAFNDALGNAERIGYLISCFVRGTLTVSERKELDDWILQSEKNELLFDQLTSEENIESTMKWYASLDTDKAMHQMKKKISFTRESKRRNLAIFAVAASLILIIGSALIFIWQKNRVQGRSAQPLATQKDIERASHNVVLTLGDGRQMILDSTAPGVMAGGMIKLGAGQIVYDSMVAAPPRENLLTVPRGGQFMVVLPDGSKVWLNAESSLRYLTSFLGSERRVVLTGEAYFEVAKNREKPFIVESSLGSVKVLGTHFNINTYGDGGALSATLLEGSVEISKGSFSRALKPGEQARLTGNNWEIMPADMDEVMAWKEGNFVFHNAPVVSIVRQLARWYDLDVEFREPVERHLNATISKDLPLSKVLRYLGQTGEVEFKLEGKKLIVLK